MRSGPRLRSSASLTLSGGTINGGTIDLTNGATLVGTSSGGTLSGVTLDGTLDLATNFGAGVGVTDGLTLGGTIDLGSADGSTEDAIYFDGAQTLGGTGSIVLGGALGNTINTASSGGDSGTLTIGSGITIEGQDGTIGNSSLPLINQGTIAANVSGGRISISGAGWSNSGTLEAENGGTLNLNGTWTDSGTVTAGSGSVVSLGGTFSLGAGSSFGGTRHP